MQRRTVIRLVGGGTVATATAAAAWAMLGNTAYPAEAVEAWAGPAAAERDPRRRAVAYAITAPNPHNLQPWLVDLRTPGVITLHTDPQRVLPETDPHGRQILVGHGCFLELLVQGLAHQGLGAQVALFPDGPLPAALGAWDRRPIARIALAGAAHADPLFAQVLRRHTPKADFDVQRPVPPDALAALLAAAASPGMQAAGTVDAARLPALRTLCEDAANVEINTARIAMESVRLTRVGPAEIRRHRDGISLMSPFVRTVDALGLFDRHAVPGPGTPAHESMTKRFAGHSRSAMGFAWIATPGGSGADAIAAGRAHVRMHLKATELGLALHPMSQPLQEFAEMRPHHAAAHRLLLDAPAPADGRSPVVQMLNRLGYVGAPAPATPRRPLDDFMLRA